jgi:N4-gp56 family major capsid protein
VKTDYIAVCSATNSVVFTTNGTATATATANLTAANVRSVVDYMKKKLIPKYDGRNYVCIASVASLSGMHSDTGAGGWVDVSKYTANFAQNIFNGEVGNYYMTRFVEETGYLSNTIGSGSVYGQSLFFGSDIVYEAVAVPEEIRVKIPQDFGRDQGLAWYALLGFKLVWSYPTDGEQHIVYVTSA